MKNRFGEAGARLKSIVKSHRIIKKTKKKQTSVEMKRKSRQGGFLKRTEVELGNLSGLKPFEKCTIKS